MNQLSSTTLHEKSVETINADGQGRVVILCEHASNFIPDRYHGLGLSDAARLGHTAWDPGAKAMAVALSNELDAPMVASTVSRLVYDCNRPPESSGAIPARSEVVDVPGNVALTPTTREERETMVYHPFCNAVNAVLDERLKAGLATVLVTLHSFTPVYFGKNRTVEIGILHDADDAFANAMLANAHELPNRVIRRNDPYGPQDGVTHSLKIHGQDRKLRNVMIEVRNDLVATPAAVSSMVKELLILIRPALLSLDGLNPNGSED